jgi:hypothetical protein
MGAQHTPGPWHVFSAYAQHEVRTPTDTLVAVVNSRSDARLVAAAPELLTVARNTVLALTSAGIEAKAVSNNPVEVLLFNAEAAVARAGAVEPEPAAEESEDPDWIPY